MTQHFLSSLNPKIISRHAIVDRLLAHGRCAYRYEFFSLLNFASLPIFFEYRSKNKNWIAFKFIELNVIIF